MNNSSEVSRAEADKKMKHYVKFIKKFHMPLIALAVLGIIYFGINGVKAELSSNTPEIAQKEKLEDKELHIVAVEDTETQDVDTKKENTPKTTATISETPQVQNIPATETVPPKILVTTRINAGSAAGNYPVQHIKGENAYQLLCRVAENNKFKISSKDYVWGIYVEGIGNLFQDGRDNFWFLYINGKSSEVGAADYQVKENDLIEWRYHEYWTY